MNLKINLNKLATIVIIGLSSAIAQSQDFSALKYFDQNTIHEVQIDYDLDGDIDYIVAGVIPEKNQGRVYLIENKGDSFKKPEYIYSFPTIPIKQIIEVEQQKEFTIIRTIGTSPSGEETKVVGTLFKGQFEGMLVSPITSN
jgi:hypothetical protein